MKKSSLLLLISAALTICAWLLLRPEQSTLPETALPTPPAATVSQQAPVMLTKSVGQASNDTRLNPDILTSFNQAWIQARFASITITQTVDPATNEPIGTIKMGSASGTLGETPPFYRVQLKTAERPILLGDKDTRHHFVRRVTIVHVNGNDLFLKPEIAIAYPRSPSLAGFVFRKEEDQITQLGIIIPDIRVPEGDDPASLQWTTQIRIDDREITADELAKVKPQELGTDIILIMPTQPGPTPASARVLWLTLDVNGSFVVTRN